MSSAGGGRSSFWDEEGAGRVLRAVDGGMSSCKARRGEVDEVWWSGAPVVVVVGEKGVMAVEEMMVGRGGRERGGRGSLLGAGDGEGISIHSGLPRKESAVGVAVSVDTLTRPSLSCRWPLVGSVLSLEVARLMAALPELASGA